MVTLGTTDLCTCFPGSLDYWRAPGARPHLHVPGGNREWGSDRGGVFKVHSAGHPLQRGGT